MGLEDRRQRLAFNGYQWGDRPAGDANSTVVTVPLAAGSTRGDSRAQPNPDLERGAIAFDALFDHMNSRRPPASVCLKAPTTKDWSLEKLISRGENFRHIRRVSATSTDLNTYIANYERDGIPLVIEGLHEHQYWPTDLFDIDWFSRHGSQHMNVRNIHNWRDSTISLSEFLQKSRSSPPFIVANENERLYGKDAECPEQWNKWLREGGVIPASLLSGGPEDYLRNLPKLNRVETLMCYLGIGDTFTPCHKDLCASSGQNLMCYTENDGCSFWFMTEGSSALEVSKYFHSLNQELDHETHVITIDELAKAPFTVYIAQQKLGDLVLVPPRSSHQVVNYGGLTIKTSWSRMTLRGLETAYYHELPLYRRVCRPETYCVKLTIHHSLNRVVEQLENSRPFPPTINSPAMSRSQMSGLDESSTKQDSSNDELHLLQRLLTLYDSIIVEEYCADHHKLLHLHPASLSTTGLPIITTAEEDDRITCDFCGSDVFQSFFECRTCISAQTGLVGELQLGDGYIVCPGCFTEGRRCYCKSMEALQCRDIQILLRSRRSALRVLDAYRTVALPDIPWPRTEADLLHEGQLGIFRAARTLQQVSYGKDRICSRQHPVLSERAISCKKCHSTKCFSHILADCYIHSASALHFSSQDKTHQDYHSHHMSSRSKFAGQHGSYLQSARQGSQPDLAFQLAHLAVKFNKCKPLKALPLQLGWYDIYAEISEVINIDTNKQLKEDWDYDVDGLSPLSSLAPSRAGSPAPVSVILPSHSAMPMTKNPLVPGFVAHTPRTILSTIPGGPGLGGKKKLIDFVDMSLPSQSKKIKFTTSTPEQGVSSTRLGSQGQVGEKPQSLSKGRKGMLVPKAKKHALAPNKPDIPQSSRLKTFGEVPMDVESLVLQKQKQPVSLQFTKKKLPTTARPASKRQSMEIPRRHLTPSWDDRPLKPLPRRPADSARAQTPHQPASAYSTSPSTSSTATLHNPVTTALNFAISENDRMLMDSRASSPSQDGPRHRPQYQQEPPPPDPQTPSLQDLNRKFEALQEQYAKERTVADEQNKLLVGKLDGLRNQVVAVQPIIHPTYLAPSTFQHAIPYLVSPQPVHPQAVYYPPQPGYYEAPNNGGHYAGGPSQPWSNHPQGYEPQYAPQSHPVWYPSSHHRSHPVGHPLPHQGYPMGPQPMPPQPYIPPQPYMPPQPRPHFQPNSYNDSGGHSHYSQAGRRNMFRQPGNGNFTPQERNYPGPSPLGVPRNMGPRRNYPNNAVDVPSNRPYNKQSFRKQQKFGRKQQYCTNDNGDQANRHQGRPIDTDSGTQAVGQNERINTNRQWYEKREMASTGKRDSTSSVKNKHNGNDNRPQTPQNGLEDNRQDTCRSESPVHDDDASQAGPTNRPQPVSHHDKDKDDDRSNRPDTSHGEPAPPSWASTAPSHNTPRYHSTTPECTDHSERQSARRNEPTPDPDPEDDANWEQDYDRDGA